MASDSLSAETEGARASDAPAEPPDTLGGEESPSLRGCIWRTVRIVILAVYLLLTTLLSVAGALLVPNIGPPLAPHLPSDSVLVLHLKNGNETWAALEEHPGLRVLWEDPEFQARTRFSEKWADRQQEWQKNKLVNRLIPLTRPGLAFALGGELAMAVEEKPAGAAENEDAPTVLFGRVQGARGGLLKALLWIADRQNKGAREHPHFLGGDLLAFEIKGGAAARPGSGLKRSPSPIGATAFIHVQQALLRAFPELWNVAGADAPERIQLHLSPSGEGGLDVAGEWWGPLPELIAPGPLPAPVLPDGAHPLLDLTMPLNARAAFLRWVDGEMSRGGKKEARWKARLGRLAEAGVDLNRDLWPYFGRTLRFQVLPAPEDSATGYAVAVASLPFRNEAAPLPAAPLSGLYEFGKAYADAFYDGTVPRDAERPYFVYVRGDENSRMVWVKSTILRPTFYLNPQGFGLLSDAGPMALTPLAPGLGPRETPAPGVFLHLKVDGSGMEPSIGMLTQMELEEQRDALGAAEFLKKVPDEGVIVAFTKKLSRLLGHVEVEIRAHAGTADGEPALIRMHWQPELR